MSSLVVERKGVWMLTIFRFLLVRCKAHFDLDRRDGHYLIRVDKHSHAHGLRNRIIATPTYLVCTTYCLRANLRQSDVIKLSLLDHLIEHFCIVLHLVIRVAPGGLEQIELLRSAEGPEDGIDAPPQVLPTPVNVQLAGDRAALDGQERAVGVLGVLLEEAGDQLEVTCGQARRIVFACSVKKKVSNPKK